MASDWACSLTLESCGGLPDADAHRGGCGEILAGFL
jgi:hypothetical protein